MSRLTDVTADGLYMLGLRGDGETDINNLLRATIKHSAQHRRLTRWGRCAGISSNSLSRYQSHEEIGMSLYTVENLLRAAGLRLTVEVDQ